MRYKKGNFAIVPNVLYMNELTYPAFSVFVAICKFSDDEGECFPSRKAISELTGQSVSRISACIKELQEKNWITVSNRTRSDGSFTSNMYIIQQFVELERVSHVSKPRGGSLQNGGGSLQNEKGGSPECDTKVSIKVSEKVNTSEPSSRDYIAEVIKEFESINSAASRFYGNTTQRDAVTKLIEIHNFERLIQIIQKLLPKTNVAYGAPNITTPLQLLEKYAALENFIQKNRNRVREQEKKANPVVNVVNGIPIKMYQT